MTKHRPILYIILLLALIALPTAVYAQAEADLYVSGVWVRPGDSGGVSAAYLHVTNYGSTADRLVGVETPIAAVVELHTMQMENDVMRMRTVDGIDIAAGETIVLRPGGLHVMLLDLQVPLVEGDTENLTLVFESGSQLIVEAIVTSQPIPFYIEPDGLTAQSLAASAAGDYLGQVVNPPLQVQDFSAPSSREDLAHFSDLDGTWRVIFFGYMRCPDFCPLTLVEYRRVKALLGDAAEDVTFVFISVDADRDTPDALRRYLANYDPEFVGFSADDDTLRRIQPDYGFYYERRLDSGSLARYTIDHSTRSYLVDRQGVLRASFAYDTRPQAMADALLWYLAHEES